MLKQHIPNPSYATCFWRLCAHTMHHMPPSVLHTDAACQSALDNPPCPAGVYPSTLSLLLRHLLLAHQNYRLFTTCSSSPKSATQDTAALPDQLIHVKIGKDPPPLPCENPGGGSGGEWLLAVEDAQARVTVPVCVCLIVFVCMQPAQAPGLTAHQLAASMVLKVLHIYARLGLLDCTTLTLQIKDSYNDSPAKRIVGETQQVEKVIILLQGLRTESNREQVIGMLLCLYYVQVMIADWLSNARYRLGVCWYSCYIIVECNAGVGDSVGPSLGRSLAPAEAFSRRPVSSVQK